MTEPQSHVVMIFILAAVGGAAMTYGQTRAALVYRCRTSSRRSILRPTQSR
jgi:hypothetical protein